MRKTQLVEIDLRSGVQTNLPLAEIGPRLRLATNTVWNYRYPHAFPGAQGDGPWMHRQPVTFPMRAGITYTGAKSFRDLGFTQHLSVGGTKTVAFGANGSDQYAAWDATNGGAELGFVGGVTRATISAGSRFLGSSVHWLNPGNDPNGGGALSAGVGAMVFAHRHANHVYYLLEGGAGIRSLTTDTTNCPAGAAALAIHLDRLWLLEATTTGLGRCWFTDPFNLDSIRTTNVIQFPDLGMGLIPGQYGAIDTSGVPHLIIGCWNSVYVLDGDPQLGGGQQADLRTLGVGVGFRSPHAAALTPYGVFFLGTDGDLWLIPPGCQSMQRVGADIRNRLSSNNQTGQLDAAGSGTGSLVWFDPYLYIFPGGETYYHFLAEPSAQSLAFWGPINGSLPSPNQREAVVRAPDHDFGTHAPSGSLGASSVHSIDTVPASGVARYLAFDAYTATTGTYPDGSNNGRTALVETGLITVLGHLVQAIRVTIEVLRVAAVGGVAGVWGVNVFDEHNTSYACTRLPEAAPTAGVGDQRETLTLHFAVPAQPASRGVALSIFNSTTGGDLGLQRAWVELHQSPAVG